MRWEPEVPFDGQLCQEYLRKKNCQNPLILLEVTIDNVGDPFLRHSVVEIYCKEHK